jgi:transcription termination factor Rho
VVHEEFKGTGNVDLYLDRSLAQKGIYPAIKLELSGTRQYEKFVEKSMAIKINALRLFQINKGTQGIVGLIDHIKKTKTNQEILNDLTLFTSGMDIKKN